MPILIGMFGTCYVVLFLGFWSLGRMSALTDKMVESRAKVLPFQRN